MTELSSCQECCNRYVVITKPSLDQVVTTHNGCDLTLNELLHYYNVNNYKLVEDNCSSKEILFQSGTHIINKNISISFENIGIYNSNLETVIIRGGIIATIKCVNHGQLYLWFYNISTVTIKNLHLLNCLKTPGLYVSFTHVYIITGTVEVSHSKFTNSALTIDIGRNDKSVKIISTTIKDTVFENCSNLEPESILKLRGSSWISIAYIILHNLNVRDNNSSFLVINVYADKFDVGSVFFTFSGRNYFTGNKGSIFEMYGSSFFQHCKLHFSKTETYIVNNMVAKT